AGHRSARSARCRAARCGRCDPAGCRIRGHPRVHHRCCAADRLRPGRRGSPGRRESDDPRLRGSGADTSHRPRLARRHRPLRRLSPAWGNGGAPVTLPLLGPMTLSGFEHSWFFLFLFAVAGLIALYVVVQLARQKRMLRFANMELLESVAPKRPSRWRHIPAMMLVAALVLFTIAMAGPTHDVQIPRNRAVVMLVIDVSQSMRATDFAPHRTAA